MMVSKRGEAASGGVWASITGTLIWALAKVDGKMAWDEWKKNSLGRYTEAYPEIWYGIWSGPDTYNSVLSKFPGQTMFEEALLKETKPGQPPAGLGFGWTDFPVMNLHPHAWPLYSATKLFGIEFTEEGVVLAPALRLESYRFQSPLLGVIKTADRYEGWYEPKVAGKWTINLVLPGEEQKRLKTLRVNGKKEALRRTSDRRIQFRGSGTHGRPLRWIVS